LEWPRFDGRLRQRNYYEHIIRDDVELNRMREYIKNNPLKWELDRENPDVVSAGPTPEVPSMVGAVREPPLLGIHHQKGYK
jgi:hypothetical protein